MSIITQIEQLYIQNKLNLVNDLMNSMNRKEITEIFENSCKNTRLDIMKYCIDYCEKKNKKINIKHTIMNLFEYFPRSMKYTTEQIDIIKYLLYLYFHNYRHKDILMFIIVYKVINKGNHVGYWTLTFQLRNIEMCIDLYVNSNVQKQLIRVFYTYNNEYNNKYIINNNFETLKSYRINYYLNYVIYCTNIKRV